MSTTRDQTHPKASPEDRPLQKLAAVPDLENGEAVAVYGHVFDPESLQLLCRRDLPAALRQLADHLEREEITGSLWNFQGNGMVQDWRRAHFLMTLDLGAKAPAQKP